MGRPAPFCACPWRSQQCPVSSGWAGNSLVGTGPSAGRPASGAAVFRCRSAGLSSHDQRSPEIRSDRTGRRPCRVRTSQRISGHRRGSRWQGGRTPQSGRCPGHRFSGRCTASGLPGGSGLPAPVRACIAAAQDLGTPPACVPSDQDPLTPASRAARARSRSSAPSAHDNPGVGAATWLPLKVMPGSSQLDGQSHERSSGR